MSCGEPLGGGAVASGWIRGGRRLGISCSQLETSVFGM